MTCEACGGEVTARTSVEVASGVYRHIDLLDCVRSLRAQLEEVYAVARRGGSAYDLLVQRF